MPSSYSLTIVPAWCAMPFSDHINTGGCWSLLSDMVSVYKDCGGCLFQRSEEEMARNLIWPEVSEAIQFLCEKSYKEMVAKGFYEPSVVGNADMKTLMGLRLALMHSELSEALEEIRDGRPLNEIRLADSGKPEGFPIELADVCLRIFDTCGALGIDLANAIKVKAEYNLTRPHKHGKNC